MEQQQKHTMDDTIAALLNIDGLDQMSPEDAQAQISSMLAELAFPMLRSEFAKVAVDRLTEWVQKIDATGNDQQLSVSKKVSLAIIDLYKNERLHDISIRFLPEVFGLKAAAHRRNEEFRDREVETLAGLLAESVGTTQGCKTIPDMFREASHARVAEKRQMPQFSNLIRLSTVIQPA